MTERLIAFFDDVHPSQSIQSQADRLGVRVEPWLEGLPPLPVPWILVGQGAPVRLVRGTTPPARGFVEWSPSDTRVLPTAGLEAVLEGGVCLAVNARTAYETDAAALFYQCLCRHHPQAQDHADIELALAEAVANAIIHGNLAIGSSLRGDLAGFARFQATLTERLADPVLGTRRVVMAATGSDRDGWVIDVTDEGDGYDVERQLAKPATTEAKSGRGLGLIRQLARSVDVLDGGRRLRMAFAP